VRRRILAVLVALGLAGGGHAPAPSAPEPVKAPPPEPKLSQALNERQVKRERRRARRPWRRLLRRRHLAVQIGRTQIGVPYGWAVAAAGRAFDCSGFTEWVARKLGRILPHSAEQQDAILQDVSREHLEPGDLLFFSYGRLGYGVADHVEMYGGNGMSIGTQSSGVAWQAVDWGAFIGGGRFLFLGGGKA
jgi:hypothetical protein